MVIVDTIKSKIYENKINLLSSIQLIIKFITVDDVNLDKKIKFFEEVE